MEPPKVNIESNMRREPPPHYERRLAGQQLLVANADHAMPVTSGIMRAAEVSVPLEMSEAAAEGLMPMYEWHHAASEAFRGGLAGLFTGILQVLAFMWLRAIMNHQYYHGGTLTSTARQLWAEGGIRRFYRGVGWALLCAPATRFGDTFAMTGVSALLGRVPVSSPGSVGYSAGSHTLAMTALAATLASFWRLLITPLDAFKTATQVQGEEARHILMARVERAGITQLWSGAVGNFCSHYFGCYPWWATMNTLEVLWNDPGGGIGWVLRTAVIGSVATAVSDVFSNTPRVLKTIRQSHPDPHVGYFAAAAGVMKVEGISGLLYRGLAARILANVLQGMFFAIVWASMQKVA